MPNFNYRYYQNPYCLEMTSNVVSCTPKDDYYLIELEDTIFYPEGGGQPADHGSLNDVEVFDVHEVNDKVIHYCRAPFEVGETVKENIDWERRFDFMQNHTGEHIMSGIIKNLFGYDNVGFHMGDFIQIDFNGILTAENIAEAEYCANTVIYRDVPVNILYPTEKELEKLDYRSKKEISGQTRLVQIDNADFCACCGTHVSSSGAVGLIKVISFAKHKNGTRIEILSGRRAFNYLTLLLEEGKKVSASLSAPITSISSYVDNMIQNNKDLSFKLASFKEKELNSQVESLPDAQTLHLQVLSDIDRNTARKYANNIVEKGKAETAAILLEADHQYDYILISRTHDLRARAKEINSTLNGRGGGSPEIIQGSFQAPLEEISRYLREIFS